MALPAGTTETTMVSASFESGQPNVVEDGGAETRTQTVSNPGLVPTVVYLEPGQGVTVGDRLVTLPPRSETEVAVTIRVPEETGSYARFLTTHRYVAVLPPSVLVRLQRIHPWLPVGTTSGTVVVPFYAVGCRLVGNGRFRRRDRETSHPRGDDWWDPFG